MRRYGECAGAYGVELESAPRPNLNMILFDGTFSTSVAFLCYVSLRTDAQVYIYETVDDAVS